jgi:oxygen-independent coproporphyrinogen-3 oxidase
MKGIYIHIPFCRKACIYCNFHFSVSLQNKKDFLNAIVKEIEIQKGYFEDNNQTGKSQIDTIYLGGGTPSLLSSTEILKILGAVNKHFSVKKNAEITIEANPEDLSKEKILEYDRMGINRLSIGVQSFFDEDLNYLGRPHNAKKALEAIKESQHAGFENITIDLIYGIPTLTNDNWQKNLEIAIENKIPHISLYALTVEPKTPLAHYIKTGKFKPLEENKSAGQYEIAMKKLDENNYIHYEISNFCKEGFFSIHNSNYWKNQPYLGIGPSAHSYNGISRQWNIDNTTLFAKSLVSKELNFVKEKLTTTQLYNEYILTSIRTMWGSNMEEIMERFGVKYYDHCLKVAEKFVAQGKTEIRDNIVFLTYKGKIIADLITAEMFFC